MWQGVSLAYQRLISTSPQASCSLSFSLCGMLKIHHRPNVVSAVSLGYLLNPNQSTEGERKSPPQSRSLRVPGFPGEGGDDHRGIQKSSQTCMLLSAPIGGQP